MPRKKVGFLLLIVCVMIGAALLTAYCINQALTGRVIGLYVDTLQKAKDCFTEYQNNKEEKSYLNGVTSFDRAVQIVFTKCEHLNLYKERQTLMAVKQLLSTHPNAVDDNLSLLLPALDRIIEVPQLRVSYGELLDFYNTVNHATG